MGPARMRSCARHRLCSPHTLAAEALPGTARRPNAPGRISFNDEISDWRWMSTMRQTCGLVTARSEGYTDRRMAARKWCEPEIAPRVGWQRRICHTNVNVNIRRLNRGQLFERRMKHKIYRDVDAIVADVPDGARIMFGGFGGAGFPNNLIQALARRGTKGIVAISNNCGTHDGELGLLFKLDRIRHVIASFPGPHATHFQERFAAGSVTLEL